jgi:hypothetical protein
MIILNQNLYLKKMNHLWDVCGNTLTPKLTDAWKTIHSCFENQLQGKKGLHVSDSICGTGKTLGISAACSVLAETQPKVGGLIVVRFIQQANELVERINKNSIGCNNVAIAYHSDITRDLKKNLEYLNDYQFIVITHASYIGTVSGKSDKKEYFRNWKHGERKFRVVDESLDLIERHSITKSDIEKYSTQISHWKRYIFLEDDYPEQMSLVKDVYKFLYQEINEEHSDISLYEKVIEKYDDGLTLRSMWEDLKSAPDTDWVLKTGKGKKTNVDIENLKENIEAFVTLFDRVIRQELWLSNMKNLTKASIGQLILPDEFESLCILDATSDVDRIYSLFEQLDETFTRYSVPRDVRDFTNVNLHILPTGSGIGKITTNSYSVSCVRNSRLINWVKNKFDKNNKILFVGHKDGIAKLKTDMEKHQFDFEYDIAWWGKLDGKNDWKDYDTVVTTSLMFLAPEHSPTAKLAFKTRMSDILDIDGDDSIASSATLVAIIQMMCRIRMRNVREGGHCEPCNVYLPLESNTQAKIDFKDRLNKRGKYILSGIESSLHNIQVDEWDDFKFVSKDEAKELKPPTVTDLFIEWISNLQKGEVYDRLDFDKTVTTNQVNALKTSLLRPNSTINQYLTEKGIVRESVKKKGTVFYMEEEE